MAPPLRLKPQGQTAHGSQLTASQVPLIFTRRREHRKIKRLSTDLSHVSSKVQHMRTALAAAYRAAEGVVPRCRETP